MLAEQENTRDSAKDNHLERIHLFEIDSHPKTKAAMIRPSKLTLLVPLAVNTKFAVRSGRS